MTLFLLCHCSSITAGCLVLACHSQRTASCTTASPLPLWLLWCLKVQQLLQFISAHDGFIILMDTIYQSTTFLLCWCAWSRGMCNKQKAHNGNCFG